MDSTQPTHSVVPYRTPAARAMQTATNAATGFLLALGLALIPILIDFLRVGSFNRTALIALISTLGIAALGVALSYLIKLQQASGGDIKPTVGASHPSGAALPEQSAEALPLPSSPTIESVYLPSLPVVDSSLLVGLVEEALRDHLKKSDQPPTLNTVIREKLTSTDQNLSSSKKGPVAAGRSGPVETSIKP